jgi:hypothetical protein
MKYLPERNEMIYKICDIAFVIINLALLYDYFRNKKIVRDLEFKVRERDLLLAEADKEADRLMRLYNKATHQTKDLS